MLARHLIDRMTQEDLGKAIEYLEQAVALDPQFALAWCELSDACASMAGMGWMAMADGFQRSRLAVDRALEAVPDLAEAHTQRARNQMLLERDLAGAELSLRRALELAPGNTRATRQSAMLALVRGRFDEAVALYRRSLERDPLSGANWSYFGRALHLAGRFAEAEAAQRKALEISPARATGRAFLAQALVALGRLDEALVEARKESDEAYRLYTLALVHHGRDERVASDEALHRLIEKYAIDAAFQVAEVYGARGESDAAFEWLERARVQDDPGLRELRVSQMLRSVHGDPRWAEFERKLGVQKS
jgi:tetratricopeptide (TPR) repeat protein